MCRIEKIKTMSKAQRGRIVGCALLWLFPSATGCSIPVSPLELKEGLKREGDVVSLDATKVPILPTCGPGTYVRRSGDSTGWDCGTPPSNFATIDHRHVAAEIDGVATAEALRVANAEISSLTDRIATLEALGISKQTLGVVGAGQVPSLLDFTPEGVTVELESGTWLLTGLFDFVSSQSSAEFQAVSVTWAEVNGSSVTLLQEFKGGGNEAVFALAGSASVANITLNAPTVVVSVPVGTTRKFRLQGFVSRVGTIANAGAKTRFAAVRIAP